MKTGIGSTLILAMIATLALPTARASADDDQVSPAPSTSTTKSKSPTDSKVSDAQNNRMQSIVGSGSRFSAHLNLTYNGAAIANPGGSIAPNLQNTIPAPTVNAQGTISLRYRLDEDTTISLGLGMELFTPFTNPSGFSASDPYMNFNRLFKFGPIHDYAQVGPILWTDYQAFTQDGYRFGLQLNNETYYVYKRLTMGLALWSGLNFFASGDYDPGQQNQFFLGGGPYAEFALSERVNIRSVLGDQADHSMDPRQADVLAWENPYQTFGVGVQILKSWYTYTYLIAAPYSGNFTAQNTGFGMTSIINLF
jgi:hypothetical protein